MSNKSQTQTVQTITGYAAAKLVNHALAEAGVDKKIPPQMIYTYLRKGYIKSHNGLVVTESFAEWLQAYVTKAQAKAAAVVPEPSDPEQAEFDSAEAN
jgi:hypothetical protein